MLSLSCTLHYILLCSQNLCTGTIDILMVTLIFAIHGEIYILITGIFILNFELKNTPAARASSMNQYKFELVLLLAIYPIPIL